MKGPGRAELPLALLSLTCRARPLTAWAPTVEKGSGGVRDRARSAPQPGRRVVMAARVVGRSPLRATSTLCPSRSKPRRCASPPPSCPPYPRSSSRTPPSLGVRRHRTGLVSARTSLRQTGLLLPSPSPPPSPHAASALLSRPSDGSVLALAAAPAARGPVRSPGDAGDTRRSGLPGLPQAQGESSASPTPHPRSDPHRIATGGDSGSETLTPACFLVRQARCINFVDGSCQLCREKGSPCEMAPNMAKDRAAQSRA